jgi:hypothetical protein
LKEKYSIEKEKKEKRRRRKELEGSKAELFLTKACDPGESDDLIMMDNHG